MRKAAAISFIYLTTAAGVVSAKDRSASAQAFMDVYRVVATSALYELPSGRG